MIAEQRSQSLYDCVSEGQISLEAIMAFPIDWQGLALEHQYTKASSSKLQDESIPTRSPLQVKRAPRSKQRQQRKLVSTSSSASSLGLYESMPASHLSSEVTFSDEDNSSCPPSPTLTFSSSEESGTSTPTPDPSFNGFASEVQDYSTKPAFSQMEITLYSFPQKLDTSVFTNPDFTWNSVPDLE
jgi:hypothetical protein